jgi:hypothetical protein
MIPDRESYERWTRVGEAAGRYLEHLSRTSSLDDRICTACAARLEALRDEGVDPPAVDEDCRRRVKYELLLYMRFVAHMMVMEATTRKGLLGRRRDLVCYRGCIGRIERVLDGAVERDGLDRVPHFVADRPAGRSPATPTYHAVPASPLSRRIEAYHHACNAEAELGVTFGIGERVFGHYLAEALRSPRPEVVARVAEEIAPEVLELVGYSIRCALEERTPEFYGDTHEAVVAPL